MDEALFFIAPRLEVPLETELGITTCSIRPDNL